MTALCVMWTFMFGGSQPVNLDIHVMRSWNGAWLGGEPGG